MSRVAIRAALEVALKAIDPMMATAYENTTFNAPDAATPYQRVNIIWARPANISMGGDYLEEGIFQVSLMFPLQAGTANCETRGKLIRDTFKRAAAFTNMGFRVTITRTPEISSGTPDGDRWYQPVKIPFSSFIYS
jgi:hypothetical protein